MSIDLYYHRPTDSGAWLTGMLWLDTVGVCTLIASAEGQPNLYGILQLDGSWDTRSVSIYTPPDTAQAWFGPDLSLKESMVMVTQKVIITGTSDLFKWDYEAFYMEPRTGSIRYSGGAPLQLNSDTMHEEYAAPFTGGALPSQIKGFLGATADRLLFHGLLRNLGLEPPYTHEDVCLFSFPRSASEVQAFTMEAVLVPAQIGVGTVPTVSFASMSLSDTAGACWITLVASYTSGPARALMLKYDHVNQVILDKTYAPSVSPTDMFDNVKGVWWSERFQVFVGVERTNINLYARQRVPYALSNPALTGTLSAGKSGKIRVKVTSDLPVVYPLATSGEVCAGTQVAWSSSTAGVFSPTVSITGADGYAETTFYPDLGITGSCNITATVVFP
jgi:hypothetical protein